ncbi:PQQ-binding-like beta-propeller repeat protein [Echinicola sediminis]
MKKNYLILLVVGYLASVQVSSAQIKGSIFLDENENGVLDPGESGISGAVVSEGFHVVKTNQEGSFDLPGWEKQRFVTVYPGPDQKVNQRYQKIEAGKKAYNFPVMAKEAKASTTFLQISDTETYEYGDWVDNLKKYIRVHQPDFVVHTGDICYQSGIKWHSEHLTEKELGIPVYYCLGNHDLIKGDYGEQYFEEKLGPAWYAFESGNGLYVITPMMGGDYPPSFDAEDIGGWLKNLMAVYGKEKPKLFFNHDLLSNDDSFRFKINENEHIDLEDYGLKAWLYGHWHVNMVKTHGESGVVSYGTATLAKGGIDHSPSCFREITVDAKGNTKSRLRWTHLEREIQIVSPSGDEVYKDAEGSVRFSVNVYDSGSEVDSVKIRVFGEEGFNWVSSLDDSKWQHMTKASDWNWVGAVQDDLEENMEVVVDAYLRSGEVLHRKKKFQVKGYKNDQVTGLDWNNLGGNKEHHSVTDKAHSGAYALKWLANVGSNVYMSSPVLFDSYALSAGFDDGNEENNFIVCWDANTGKEKWKVTTENGVKNQMVVAKGKVIATDMLGFTYAIDIATGKQLWKRDLKYHRLPGFVTGIVTDGDIVYTGFAERLTALDVEDGKIIWQNTKQGGGEGSTPTMTIAGDVLVTARHWTAIDAYDRHTGKLLWSKSDHGLRFRDGVLSFSEGSLWVAERESFDKGKLFELSPKTGEVLSSFYTEMQNTGTSAPIVLKDKIIVAGSHPGVAAFDRKTNQKIWEFEVDEALFYTPSYFADQQQSLESTPVLVGDKLIFGAMDGKVYVLDINTGRLLWKKSLGAPVITSAAISDNGFYIADFAGNIYCFQSIK